MTANALQKTSKRNSSIDITRYICAVMVVAIHSRVFLDIDKGVWNVFNAVFFRNAVPFFFAVSGYFFIKNALGDIHKEKAYLLRIVKTYVIWSVVYFVVEFISDVVFGSVSALNFIKSSLIGFFLTGSHYHFWYFPSLIYSAILVMIFYRLKIMKLLTPLCVILLFLGCLGCAYYGIGKHIPFVSGILKTSYYTVVRRAFFTGVPFFSSGYLIIKLENLSLSKQRLLHIWYAVTVFDLLEMLVLYLVDWIRWVNVSIGIYPFIIFTVALLNSYPMPQFYKSSKLFRYLANFTYYSHPLFITVFTYLFAVWGMKLSKMQTIKFVIITVVTFLIGSLIYQLKFTKKFKKQE